MRAVIDWTRERCNGHVVGLGFCFGGPVVIEQIRTAFSEHSDAGFTNYPGLVHGYSHDGENYDEAAAREGVDDTPALLSSLRSAPHGYPPPDASSRGEGAFSKPGPSDLVWPSHQPLGASSSLLRIG